jgi:hypothetical protein
VTQAVECLNSNPSPTKKRTSPHHIIEQKTASSTNVARKKLHIKMHMTETGSLHQIKRLLHIKGK